MKLSQLVQQSLGSDEITEVDVLEGSQISKIVRYILCQPERKALSVQIARDVVKNPSAYTRTHIDRGLLLHSGKGLEVMYQIPPNVNINFVNR